MRMHDLVDRVRRLVHSSRKRMSWLDEKKLKNFLEGCTKKYDYIYLGEKKENLTQLLNNHDFAEIGACCHDESFRKNFIQQYLELIGKLDLKYHSFYWWATHTAAKNQFGSEVLEHLFILSTIRNSLRDQEGKSIVVFNAPREMHNPLRQMRDTESFDLKIIYSRLRSLYLFVVEFPVHALGALLFVYDCWKRKYVCNKYLKRRIDGQLGRKRGSYYILRSFFYSKSINEKGEYHDSFFGVLPHYLTNKGIKLVVVARIQGDYGKIVKQVRDNEFLIIPEEFVLRIADPIKVVIDCIRHKPNIKERMDFDGFDVSGIIQSEIDREFRRRGVFRTVLCQFYAKRLLEMIDVNTFTTTYENRPWEKIYFLAFQKWSGRSNTIGYQHSPLFKASIDMVIGKYERDIIPMPDTIITNGRISKGFLEQYGNYDPSRVKVGCALRYEVSFDGKLMNRAGSNRILVVLGGVPSRAVELVHFVRQSLMKGEKYRVIIRAHPALPWEYIKSDLGCDMGLCGSISVSDNKSVGMDLESADIVMYDASSIAIEALRMGIPVIHVALNDLLSFDPLVGFNYFKWTVRSAEDLKSAIRNIDELSDGEYRARQVKARAYSVDYAYEITEERLGEFMI